MVEEERERRHDGERERERHARPRARMRHQEMHQRRVREISAGIHAGVGKHHRPAQARAEDPRRVADVGDGDAEREHERVRGLRMQPDHEHAVDRVRDERIEDAEGEEARAARGPVGHDARGDPGPKRSSRITTASGRPLVFSYARQT